MTEAAAELLICPNCGYDLRVATDERCPECGQSAARARALGWQIPWVHRRSLGWWRAYWRTAWRVTFRGKALLASLPGTVEYADAQRFRWATLGFLWLTLLLVAGVYGATYEAFSPGYLGSFAGDAWFVVTGPVCALLALAAMTGAPSYLFHPRKLTVAEQNRAIALSYYMCAPLAWAWVAVPLVLSGVLIQDVQYGRAPDGPPWSLLVVLAIAVMVWWWRLVELAVQTMPTRMLRLRVAFITPVHWIFTALLAVALPMLVFYLVLLVRTFR